MKPLTIMTIILVTIILVGCRNAASPPAAERATNTAVSVSSSGTSTPEDASTDEPIVTIEAMVLPAATSVVVANVDVTAVSISPLATPSPAQTEPATSSPVSTSNVTAQTAPTFLPSSPTPNLTGQSAPSATSTMIVVVTPEVPFGFEMLEAQVETNAAGETLLTLPVTLNQDKLRPPVQELIYSTTIQDVDQNLSETTFWKAAIQNINNPQLIYLLQQEISSRPEDPTLSPDGKFLVYGINFNDRTYSIDVALLNIDQGTFEVIDGTITNGGAAPRTNSQSFIWATDSQSFIYIKEIEEGTSSEVYQYSLQSNEISPIFKNDGYISFVSWQNDTIYYVDHQFNAPSQQLKSYHLGTHNSQILADLKNSYSTNLIKTSPDRAKVLFQDGNLIELGANKKIQLPDLQNFLWLPDSSGFVSDFPAILLSSEKLNQQISPSLSLNIRIPFNNEDIDWVNWSPDAQYIVYRLKNNDNPVIYSLLDLQTGETQTFNQPISVIGWSNE